MKGYPKQIATRQDVDHLMNYLGTTHDTPELRAQGLVFVRGLLDTQKHYVFDKVLATAESPTGPEPDYVVRDVMLPDDTTERHQFALVDNPGALIYQLGYSVADVNALITQLGG